MRAQNLLRRLCERHGVQPSRCESLLPLVQWALRGPEESRDYILTVVERAIADHGEGRRANPAELIAAADRAVLAAVARVLHRWEPDDRLAF